MGGFLTYNHMTIGWLSRKQDAVALSTAEAEYRAIAKMTQRVVYERTLARTFETKDDNNGVVLENENMQTIDGKRNLRNAAIQAHRHEAPILKANQ